MHGRMRSLLVLALIAASSVARAETTMSLVDVEVRAGWGLEVGGAAGQSVVKTSPMMFAARAAIAIQDEPAMWAYVGAMTEAGARSSAGVNAGVRFAPREHLRLSLGGLWITEPYSLFGGTLAIGSCLKASGAFHVCGDVEASLLWGGTDLPQGRSITQTMFVLGVRFDAM
jgi:hypothetical protein